MSLEVNPVGVACNIACKYCYEQPMRDAGNITEKLDLDAIIAELDKEKQEFSLFGGEPLLAPIKVLERLFEYGFKRFRRNGIQTNGTLITDKHYELFKQYNVHVGFSIDGPSPINDVRCNEEQTSKSIKALDTCLSLGIGTSLIITIHQAHWDYSNIFYDWLSHLDNIGLKSVRLHLLERDNNVSPLDPIKLDQLLCELEKYELMYKNIKFDIFNEIYELLKNPLKDVTCVWNGCDPLTTNAVQGIGPSGQRYNCGRTNKEGINWRKANTAGKERQIALYYTDCKDCRFFLACKGYCPGTAIDGDWRRKSEHCGTLIKLFTRAEANLKTARIPVYTDNPKLKEMEMQYLQSISGASTKGCRDRSESHEDWHIDSNAKIIYTGNVPVYKRR